MKGYTENDCTIPTQNKQFLLNDNFQNSVVHDKSQNAVDHPAHYNHGSIECIDALNAMVEGWDNPVAAVLAWQTVKYIWRHPFKGKSAEDLKKARFYLDRLIAQYERPKED